MTSLPDKLQSLSERAEALAKEIRHNERLLELMGEAKVSVHIATEYFAGNLDFGSEITEWIRERTREQLTDKLEQGRKAAQELMGK